MNVIGFWTIPESLLINYRRAVEFNGGEERTVLRPTSYGRLPIDALSYALHNRNRKTHFWMQLKASLNCSEFVKILNN